MTSVFPHGVRRGSEIAVEIRGSYLDGPGELRFLESSLSGTVESSEFRVVRARIRAAHNAEPGRHDLRLVTPRGIWFGFFWVGDQIEERVEVEPNDTSRQARLLALPAVVHGRADAADGDYYRFRAQAGQTIVFDVIATRLGSALDPALTLLDSHDREIAYNDDAYSFKDARLVHTFQQGGEFCVVVSASFERSGRDAEYRLQIATGPFALSALPLGAQRGGVTEVSLRGWNLESVRQVWMDRTGAPGEILARAPDQLRVRIHVPSDTRIGTHQLHVGDGPPVRFEISDLPEIVAGPETKATAVKAPIIVNGEIPDTDVRLKRVQEFALDVKAGERLEFAVDSWKLGHVIDPVFSLFDSAGHLLAEEDDPAPNSFIHHPATHDPRLVYAFTPAGRYRLQLRDAAYQAGGGYRLVVRKVEPSFETEVRAPQLAALAGRTTSLLAVIRRTGGVRRVEAFRKSDSEIEHFRLVESDGWNTRVRVSVAGLPAGVSAREVIADPVNTVFKGNDGEELFVDGTLVEIPITVSAEAKAGLYPIELRASGEFQGRKLERKATVLYGAPRASRHQPTPDQILLLNVIQAPRILWNTPGEISLSKGEPGRLKVGFVRLDGDYPVSVSASQTIKGWTFGTAQAAAGTEEVELPVTIGPGAHTEAAALVLLATFDREGRKQTVESPPIQLKVKP